MESKKGKIEIKDGSKINYRLDGDISKPTIVMVSGSIFNYKQFDYVLYPSLKKNLVDGYSFLFYDYVGIGESSQLKGEFDFLTITRQHIEILEALGIESAHHFGYSKGALISYLAAAGHPSFVKSIGSYGTPNLAYTKSDYTKQEYSTRLQYLNSITGIWDQEIGDKNYKIVYDTVFLPTIFRGKQQGTLGPIDKIKNRWIRNRIDPLLRGTLIHNLVKLYELYKRDITEEEKQRYIDAMQNLEQKTLLMHSRNDEILPYPNSEELNKLVKNSELVTYEKYGHSSPVLRKKEGNTIMKQYAKFLSDMKS